MENAIHHFQKAIDLNPKFGYPLNNMGFLYLSIKEIKRALSYFNKVTEIEDSNPLLLSKTYAGLAICMFIENKKEPAIEFKTKSLILNDNLSNTNYLRPNLNWNNEMIKIYSAIWIILVFRTYPRLLLKKTLFASRFSQVIVNLGFTNTGFL